MAKLTLNSRRVHKRTDFLSTVVVAVLLAFALTLSAQVQAQSPSTVKLPGLDCTALKTGEHGQRRAPVLGSRGLRDSGESRCRKESLSALRVLGIWAVFTR